MGKSRFHLQPQAWTCFHFFTSLHLLPCVFWGMDTASPSHWGISGACSCFRQTRAWHHKSNSLSEFQMLLSFTPLLGAQPPCWASGSRWKLLLISHAVALSAAAQRWCEALALRAVWPQSPFPTLLNNLEGWCRRVGSKIVDTEKKKKKVLWGRCF